MKRHPHVAVIRLSPGMGCRRSGVRPTFPFSFKDETRPPAEQVCPVCGARHQVQSMRAEQADPAKVCAWRLGLTGLWDPREMGREREQGSRRDQLLQRML